MTSPPSRTDCGVALALEAMATRFELILRGSDVVRLRAIGEEALREIEEAEARLSRHRPASEVAWINARAGGLPVRVDARVFRLIQECAGISHKTDGAFDPSVGPLLRAWGFVGGSGHRPEGGELASARGLVGMRDVELDASASTVRLPRAGMELDLGGVGKGWALDRAAAVLEEHGIENALLHGGTSSVHVLGRATDGTPWRIGWRIPGEVEPRVLELNQPAVSISAPHGRCFTADGRLYGHVLDPRTGEPAQGVASACVTGASSTLCDALSTALLVLGERGLSLLTERFPGYSGSLANPTVPAEDGGLRRYSSAPS